MRSQAGFGTTVSFPNSIAPAIAIGFLPAHDAIVAMEKKVDELLSERDDFGQPHPDSLADHRYSGKFLIRTSRALYARLL